MRLSKRMKAIREKCEPGKIYSALDAIKLLQEVSKSKFIESVDASVELGINAKDSNQMVRGSVILVKGTGKQIRVAVFAPEEQAVIAKNAGAEIAGLEDLVSDIKAGKMDFDVAIATPDAMRFVGQVGKTLGPRGLMPNPKDGTVTNDIEAAVKNAKSGQVRFRNDKYGLVHAVIGKINFAGDDLLVNLNCLLAALKKAKPATSKGVYFKKLTLSSTMGPGLQVDLSAFKF